MAQPPVSIIITPRERYTWTRPSVLSVLDGLDKSIEVIFVAGNAPPEVLAFLQTIKKKRPKFAVVRADRYLRANEARNLGLGKIKKGNDVLFIENDVVVRKGWLVPLIRRLQVSQADIVAPLVYEGDISDPDPLCHIAGANLIWEGPGKSGKVVGMEHFLNHERADGKALRPQQVDVVEFHCLLIRRKTLDQLTLKKKYNGLFAHLDLCLQAEKRGVKVMVEPESRVLFVNPAMSPIRFKDDFDFFMFQWGEKESMERIRDMSRDWGMDPGENLLWEFQGWVRWNKSLIFASTGALGGVERLLWRAARIKGCPHWIPRWLEGYLAWRIRRWTKWEPLGPGK